MDCLKWKWPSRTLREGGCERILSSPSVRPFVVPRYKTYLVYWVNLSEKTTTVFFSSDSLTYFHSLVSSEEMTSCFKLKERKKERIEGLTALALTQSDSCQTGCGGHLAQIKVNEAFSVNKTTLTDHSCPLVWNIDFWSLWLLFEMKFPLFSGSQNYNRATGKSRRTT